MVSSCDKRNEQPNEEPFFFLGQCLCREDSSLAMKSWGRKMMITIAGGPLQWPVQ
jgi:hypothetical protein